MKRWQASCAGALAAIVLGGGALVFLVPFGGALIAGVPPVFERLTAFTLCREAVDYSYRDYGFGQPTSSDPTAGTGHYTELTCTYEDGSQRVFPNDEVGLKGLAAAFAAAGICGGAGVLALTAAAAVIGGRLVKPRQVA